MRILVDKSIPPVIILLGATGVGKTKVSLELAEKINGEILSIDSRLFYRGMNIGTAKPSEEELNRVPHHFINIAEPDEVWNLGRFQKEAKKKIVEIHNRGNLPICVGGTGQYIQAITQGWDIPELKEDFAMRDALNAWGGEIGKEGLYERLKTLDPLAAKQIDARNLRRTVRALEVILRTGKLFSEQRSQKPLPYRILQIGLSRPREEIYARVEQRVESMMKAGFLEEVKILLKKYPPDLRSFSAIGYKQLIAYLQGELPLEEAVEDIVRKTKLYVRRQNTWFKPDDPLIKWVEMGEGVGEKIEDLVGKFLEYNK